MSIEVTKVWIENDKLFALQIPESEVYKREWVGLTDDEYRQIQRDYFRCDQWKAIEAKLKEKNT